ncbi:hypothetical protein CCAX7_56070 [Capsulimonas corticalis]|uniref:Uncharacterized protein n=1 Tax=Capsulimonas corticalis TaxID=2219043 RepID=A0A402D0M8_9BACT|nr:hypothetical protein [Capsulimonas corticalis]BDI33556.1 hypothetical protein CCAX7_56070 [Capsulimonas corticalis]
MSDSELRPQHYLYRDRHTDEDYARLAAQFGASYMSSAKWFKVLTAIAQSRLHLQRATWKFIDSDRLFPWPPPGAHELELTHLADCGSFPPIEYKWIEWISFPRTWSELPDPKRPQQTVSGAQDIDALARLLDATAQTQYIIDDDGLTLFAYRH